jgi:tetratricopeptide (TPR) repeat protein
LDKAAQLVAQAKSVDDRIATARTASAESTKQAQVNLAAAQTTQRRIDTINAQIEQKGIPLNKAEPSADVPAAAAAAPPSAAPAPPPATPAPAPAETPAKTTPPGDYKAIYRQAINARDRKRWSDAAQLFQSAASIKPDTGETISMPGFGDEQRYLPFYNLGIALQNMKDCTGAIKAWDQAEQAGAVLKSSRDADAMRKARAQCGPPR